MNNFDTAGVEITRNYVNGEIVIDGTYNGNELHQAIPAKLPCAVFFDPVSLNFEVVPLPADLTNKNLVAVIKDNG